MQGAPPLLNAGAALNSGPSESGPACTCARPPGGLHTPDCARRGGARGQEAPAICRACYPGDGGQALAAHAFTASSGCVLGPPAAAPDFSAACGSTSVREPRRRCGRPPNHAGMCIDGAASWWTTANANRESELKAALARDAAFAALAEPRIRVPAAQPARCGAICPEQTDALCARSEGHVGRHEGNGIDWWDGADSRARVTATITLARAGDAVPTYVDPAPAPAPYVIDAQETEKPTVHHETLRAMLERRAAENGARREKCAAELKTEVARAAKHADAAADALGQRHGAEWTALTAKALAGVGGHPAVRIRLLRTIAEAIELSANQGSELVLSSHQVLDTELAQLFPTTPPARKDATWEEISLGAQSVRTNAPWADIVKATLNDVPVPAPAPAAPATATASNVTMDALVSGDPLTVCRALWSGEAADDGAHVIRRLSELAHVYMADSDLETMHAELVAELLLSLGAPRSARA